MKITHIGAKNCVTGSCHLVQATGVNLLVDCGIAQGHDPMLRDAMSFSTRSDARIRTMEARIDDLSWGFELYDTFSLKNGISFTLKNPGHILGSCFIQFSLPTARPPWQRPWTTLTRTPWPPGWQPCPNPRARSGWCMGSQSPKPLWR